MKKQTEMKQSIVSEIAELFKDAKSIVFVDYRGITVAEDTKLRREFRSNDCTYKVYKNRLIMRALDQLGISDYDKSLLEGTTAVAVGMDEVAPAKVFGDAIKNYKKMEFKFGIVNGKMTSKEQVEALSKLPAKPVLISMLLGMLNAPVSSLARTLVAVADKQS